MRVRPWDGEEGIAPKEPWTGNSLVVQWLGLLAFTAEGLGSIPGWRTKIPRGAAKKTAVSRGQTQGLGHMATAFCTWQLKEQIYGKLLFLFVLGSN